MHIIDFNEKKRRKAYTTEKNRQEKLLMQFQHTRKSEYLHQLVETQKLHFEAHQLFLAFMYAVETEDKKLETVCKDALTLHRQQFHSMYPFDWWTSVQCALTFLAIQKETKKEAYERYIDVVMKK